MRASAAMMLSRSDDLHRLPDLLILVTQGFFRVPRFHTSICLLGTRRSKEIVELVHQSVEIRAGDSYFTGLSRDRARRDESDVLPIAPHHRRGELNVRMLALEPVKPRNGAPPWRQSARNSPVSVYNDAPLVEALSGRVRRRSSAAIMPRRMTAISSACAG